jgi:hypothetical protein
MPQEIKFHFSGLGSQTQTVWKKTMNYKPYVVLEINAIMFHFTKCITKQKCSYEVIDVCL